MKLSDWRDCEDIPVVYGIKNIKSEKWYIGSCHSMLDRMRRHYYNLSKGAHHSIKLQRAWNKYGEAEFEVQVLLRLNKDTISDMFSIEEEYIKKYDSKNNGYNILDICKYRKKFKQTEEAKRNSAISHSKPVVAIDRFTNKVLKQYSSITEAANDIKESTSNISQVCLGRLRFIKDRVFVYLMDYDESKDYIVTEHHMKGVPKSEEWKEKARLSSKIARQIYKYTLDGKLLEIYSSRSYAEKQEGFKKEFLRTRLDKPINGFIFTEKEIKDIV